MATAGLSVECPLRLVHPSKPRRSFDHPRSGPAELSAQIGIPIAATAQLIGCVIVPVGRQFPTSPDLCVIPITVILRAKGYARFIWHGSWIGGSWAAREESFGNTNRCLRMIDGRLTAGSKATPSLASFWWPDWSQWRCPPRARDVSRHWPLRSKFPIWSQRLRSSGRAIWITIVSQLKRNDPIRST